jgi:predicted NBD/HSP70 family sugar kinase
MYLGIDIGGTKTLAAVLDDTGVIQEKLKFPTNVDYDQFLIELATTIRGFSIQDFKACGLAMPVTVFDRKNGVGVNFGNLPWKNVSIHRDVEKIADCPVVIDNDAKLGGLSEALMLKDEFSKVMYVTVSTGIGLSFVEDGVIDENFGDGGGRSMLFEHKGKLTPWESFASGRAIVDRYGKMAMEITDEPTWSLIVRDLAPGILQLIAIMQPEVIVIGGSVGTYFERYGSLLIAELKKFELPLIKIPEIRGAQRPEEAVVYGCYDLAKLHYGTAP